MLGKAPTSALLIDCSTIDVARRRSIEEEAAAQGYTMVDAPVSGGIAAAASGNLAFMVGGSDEAFARAQPFLDPMAKAVIHAGGAGAGQAAKICNNMILGATMIVTCEAFVMAQKLGLDPQVFFDIASKASGQSWSMTTYTPVPGVGPETPADHDYEGGFAAALMLKDLKLAMDAAQHAGAYTPMGAEAEELYQRFVNLGGGSKDFSGDHQDDRRQLESDRRKNRRMHAQECPDCSRNRLLCWAHAASRPSRTRARAPPPNNATATPAATENVRLRQPPPRARKRRSRSCTSATRAWRRSARRRRPSARS